MASATILNSGGLEIVGSGGIASATTVSSGGNLTISGTASGSTVSTGGVELVEFGRHGGQHDVFAGAYEEVFSDCPWREQL